MPAAHRHFTASVTVPRLATDPTLRMMGTLFPEGAPEGIWTLNWLIPATMPGASPAQLTGASTPPIVAVTGGGMMGYVPIVNLPSALAGTVWPPPVPQIMTVSPCAAGLARSEERRV